MSKFNKKVKVVDDGITEDNFGKDNFVVIDGSLLAFRVAAAGEKRDIVAKHLKSGKEKQFDNRTAFKVFLKEKNAENVKKGLDTQFLITDFEIEDRQHPPEEKISLHILKEMINYILSACGAKDYLIIIDNPDDTFRHELATVQEYKGNRKGLVKPANLQLVKDHMVLHYSAKIAQDGYEGDDILNWYAWKGYQQTKEDSEAPKIIQATFDKDGFGCMGWLFDFRKDDEGKPFMRRPVLIDGLGSLYLNDKGDVKGKGRIWAYYQWGNQDTADNYKASKLSKKRFGDKAAYKLLKDCKSDKEAIQLILKQFKEWYPEPVKYVSWDGDDMERDWKEIAQEYLDLSRMTRWDGDVVLVEDLIQKFKVGLGE